MKRCLSILLVAVVLLTVQDVSILAETARTEEKAGIPVDAAVYNDHYYYVYRDALSWKNAKELCEKRGGYLAVITSQEENDFLYEYIQSQGNGSAYFGMTDCEMEGVWSIRTGIVANQTQKVRMRIMQCFMRNIRTVRGMTAGLGLPVQHISVNGRRVPMVCRMNWIILLMFIS